MRVQAYLTDQSVPHETLHHAPAFHAQKRAKRLGVSGHCVVKCALLATQEGYWIAMLPATYRINVDALERHLKMPVRFARLEEIDQLFLDCEWGVVPPFGRLYGVPTLIDDCLSDQEIIVLEGHLHVHSIRMRRQDFERLEQPRRARFSEPVL